MATSLSSWGTQSDAKFLAHHFILFLMQYAWVHHYVRVSRILGKREQKVGMTHDKGHHTIIYRLDLTAQCFFAALLDLFVKHSNRAITCINRAVKNVLLSIPPGTHIDDL